MATRDSTRTKLLDAADELLFTRGVVATPVDAILERAGVSPATLYRAFGSKEGLVAAALDRRHREWIAVWDACVARATDDRGRLLAVLDALDEFQRRPDAARWCAFLGTAAEYADPPAVLAAAIQQDSDSMRARLAALAEPLAGSGAPALADALVLVVSGHLALGLRGVGADGTAVARSVAEALVSRT
ncbi:MULTISPECIES: TetR/AcrR family transcriptional regulator [unclassified Nocardioides]|uniref:TetR/AcrR family transcriptional regulator n=1 Tax=unclassified Nocardioides TaxID=2615069 RepID=UPI0030146E9A